MAASDEAFDKIDEKLSVSLPAAEKLKSLQAELEAAPGLGGEALERLRKVLDAHSAAFDVVAQRFLAPDQKLQLLLGRWETFNRMFEAVFEKFHDDSPLARPYLILIRPKRFNWRQRRQAAREIAASMKTRVANPKARIELTQGDGPSAASWVRETLFVPALMEAASEWLQPQPIRVGRTWLKDARGRKALTTPAELDARTFRRWLKARAYAIAERKLLAPAALDSLTDKERDIVLLASKRSGATPAAIKKRAARAGAKLHGAASRSQRGRPA
jgi:hypothetical protein